MPVSVPVPTKSPGDVFTSSLFNTAIRDNINKLLDRGHRVLTVAQFSALTGLEGTKGTVAPDEVYLEVDSANGIQWHLAYESGEATYKWRFVGGPPLFSEVATSETTTSATYVALATAGPSVALPRSGDYDVTIAAWVSVPGAFSAFMSYDIGATGAVDTDAIDAPSTGFWGRRKRRKAGLTPVTLTAKYKVTPATQTGTFKGRQMEALPVRIRHDA